MKKYKLGELIEVTRGTSLSGNYYATSGDYIRLTCGNFDYRNNCFKENSSKDNIYYIGEFKSDFLLNEGDIITPLTEQAIGLLGSTAWIPESGKYIQSQDIGKIICKEKLLDKKFAYYLLSSKEVKKQLSAGAQQTKIRHTSPSKIKDSIVWIPSLYEQKNIGEILFNIDRKIALNKAINHNLVAMAKQLYDYWFVQFDFPNEDGKPYKSSGGKMVWNEKLKREIPEGWEATTFVSLIKNSRNGDWGKETIIGNYTEKVYCIRGTDINGLKEKERIKLPTRFILKKNNEKYLSENEFVVEISGGSPTQSTGRIILLTRKMFERFDSNIICSNFCKSISLKEKKYIFFFLQEWERLYNNRTLFDYEGKTSGIKNFLFDDFINSYKIILPSKNIVEKFYSYSENIDNKLQESLKEIESLSKQRDELLPLLMNDQVTIG